jgi:prolyl-tRNA editing enzyme YbaK/EbsC (Cys-tRNA(Pro) deacylase)
MPVEAKIVGILKENKSAIDYEVVEHEPVYTNPAMAEALGVSEAETVKSLVLLTKEKGDGGAGAARRQKSGLEESQRLGIGTKKVSFAKPDAGAAQPWVARWAAFRLSAS